MNLDTVLATDKEGNNITVADVKDWILNKDKIKLANFIYDRLYNRYLKPFYFEDENYIKNYKNGFAIMASCCLLIETFISFRACSGIKNWEPVPNFV